MSNVLIEDNKRSLQDIYKIEDISNELLDYLIKFKDIENFWNNYNLWLLINIFFYYWKNVLQHFQNEIFNKYISTMDDYFEKIKDLIGKWRTDFNFELIIGVSFLIFKEKDEFLNFIQILNQKFDNTIHSDLIECIINLIITNDVSPKIFNIKDNNFEITLSIILLLTKFGNIDYLKISNKLLMPLINNLRKNIKKKREKLEVFSCIRDWLCAKYIQLLLYRKLETSKVIPIEELDYFSLSPRKFERLVFWITKINNKWKNVQWRGASGSERGKDIFAVKRKNNRVWIIQAKRVKNFGPKHLENEILKVQQELDKYQSEGYTIFIAKNATEGLRKRGELLAQTYNIKIEIKDRADLDFILKNSPKMLKEFFNYPV